VDGNTAGAYMYGFIYNYYQQFINGKNQMYAVVGWCWLAVTLLCLLFQFSIQATLITSCVCIMGVVELWGLLPLINVEANALTAINLSAFMFAMMAAFTVHLVHIFSVKKGDRNTRMTLAMEEVLPSAVHMYAISFLCIVVLSASRLPFLNLYYWGTFALMEFVAVMNGMLLLPVLLSLFGPESFYARIDASPESGAAEMSTRKLEVDQPTGY